MTLTGFLNNWLLNSYWQTGIVILSVILGIGLIRKGGLLKGFILGTAIMWAATNLIAFFILYFVYTPT